MERTEPLTVRPFEPADYLRLAGPSLPGCDLARAADDAAKGGPAFTLTVDGQVAACAGVILFPYPGVGHAWAVIGSAGRRHGLVLTRRVVQGLTRIIGDHRLWRVEAEVVADFALGRRWLEWMGFEEEGLMRRRGPNGLDMRRYALFPVLGTEAVADRLPPILDGLVERNGATGVEVNGHFRPAISGGTGIETAAIIGIAASVAVAGVSAYAQYQQGQAQSQALKYNAKVADNQAIAAQQQAQYIADQQRDQTRRVLARQRALYGTAGVDVGVGSPLMVLADSAREGELNAQATLASGTARAQGFQAQAQLDRYMAGQAQTAGNIGAGVSLLSGLGSAGAQYYRYAGTSPSGGGIRVPTTAEQLYGNP